MKEPVDVVAAVIRRRGRYLLARRPSEKRHGDLWEFPGGKLDHGEDVDRAARRELSEELALTVVHVGAALHSVRDPEAPFLIHFHAVTAEGDPEALEHSAVRWFTLDELVDLPLAPADRRFVSWMGSREAQEP